MDTFSLKMFVVPILALASTVALYIYYANHVNIKSTYRHFIIRLAVTAFVLNLVWELLHAPLYKDFEYDFKHIVICTLASFADMLMVLMLFFAFSIGTKDPFWIKKLNVFRITILMVVGGGGAVFSEMWHRGHDDWQYTNEMPLLPILDVGITPILQFMLLPWFSFLLAKKIRY